MDNIQEENTAEFEEEDDDNQNVDQNSEYERNYLLYGILNFKQINNMTKRAIFCVKLMILRLLYK